MTRTAVVGAALPIYDDYHLTSSIPQQTCEFDKNNFTYFSPDRHYDWLGTYVANE